MIRYDGPLPWWGPTLFRLAVTAGRVPALVGGRLCFAGGPTSTPSAASTSVISPRRIWLGTALKRRGRFVIPRQTVLTSNRKVDRMSLRRAAAELFRIFVHGPEAYRSKEGLGLWYGPEAREG